MSLSNAEALVRPDQEIEIGPLRDLCRRLEDFSDISERLVTAFDREDVDAVLELAIRSRHARAAVHRAQKTYNAKGAPQSAEAIDLMVRMADATNKCRAGDELILQWIDRPVPPAESLLRSPQGVVAYTESILPSAWDLDRDVVLLAGQDLENVAEVLRRVGQQRVVLLTNRSLDSSQYPETVIVTESAEQVYTAIRSMLPNPPTRLVARKLVASGLDETEFEKAHERAKDALRDLRISGNTVGVFADTWMEQGIANLPEVAKYPSIAALTERFRGRPMVCIAPGPSLAKNIDKLAALKGKALLVTFSHTLAAVKKAGVVPDLVLTVDSNALQYHFADYPTDEVPALVHGGTVHPDLFNLPAKRIFTIGANAALDSWLFEIFGEADDAVITSGGSVATAALVMGSKLQCNPIMFVGLDLSFPDGKYYIESCVDGSVTAIAHDDGRLELDGWGEEISKLRDSGGPRDPDFQPLCTLPGWNGGTVPTSFLFKTYHRWFCGAVKALEGTIEVVNATEGGAYIEGMEHLTLEAAADKYINHLELMDVEAELDGAIAQTDSNRRLSLLLETLESMRNDLEKSTRTASRCADLATIALENPAAMDRLETAEKKLQASLQQVNFVSMLRQHEIERASERALHATSLEELLEASGDLFEVIITAGEQVLPRLEQAIERLRQAQRS